MAISEYPKTIAGLIVVIFLGIGTAAFYPQYFGTDRCQAGGVYGTWEPVTELVYFNDTFPAIGRYYCSIETELTSAECLLLDKLLNADGCKWGGKTSKSKKTLYVMIDPPLPGELDQGYKILTDNIKLKDTKEEIVTYFNKTSYTQVNCTNETVYYNCSEYDMTNETICNYTYQKCDTLKTITEYNKTKINSISFDITTITKEYDFRFKGFGNCSYHVDSKDNTKVWLECDSWYDSNRDGVWSSGESGCLIPCNKDECDMDFDKYCEINHYIFKLQKKHNLNKLSVSEKAVIKK